MKAFHNTTVGVPSFGPFLGIQDEIAEAEELACPRDCRSGSPRGSLGHRYPFVHIRFCERAEVEQIRAMVERDHRAQGPATVQWGISSASVNTCLRAASILVHRAPDDGNLGPLHAEFVVAGRLQARLECRQLVHASYQVQRQRAVPNGSAGRPFKVRGIFRNKRESIGSPVTESTVRRMYEVSGST